MAGLWTLYGRQWTLYGKRWGLYIPAVAAEQPQQPGGFIPETIYLDEKGRPVSKGQKKRKPPVPEPVEIAQPIAAETKPPEIDVAPLVAKSMADLASLISQDMRKAMAQMREDDELALILLMAA